MKFGSTKTKSADTRADIPGHTRLASLRLCPALLLAAAVAGPLLTSCGDEKTEMIHLDTDGERVPTMLTRDVTTLISDSGITKYRITTDLWLVFEEAAEPHWRFPEGLFMEKFDSAYDVNATIAADSATYWSNKGLWRLDGNVNVLNLQGEKFLTQQLFWDQRNHKIYSDSFIHVEKQGRTIEGYGFNSNERMTTYTVLKPSGIFPASDFRGGRKADTASTSGPATLDLSTMTGNDTVKAAPGARSSVRPSARSATRPSPAPQGQPAPDVHSDSPLQLRELPPR